MIRYSLYKVYSYGGVGVGIFFILLGCFTIFISWSGLLLIIIGSFLFFTDSACVIDEKNFRISFPFELFGIIRIGNNWIYVRSDMELYMTEAQKPYLVRDASQKLIDVSASKYLIFLFDPKTKKKYLILKSKSKKKTEDELDRLSDILDIHIRGNNFSVCNKILKI